MDKELHNVSVSIISKPKGLLDSWLKELAINKDISVLSDKLIEIGFLDRNDRLISYADIDVWQRGGAETYIATAMIDTKILGRKKFIAKALVSAAKRPEQQLKEWLRNRERLTENGINVPKLYWTDPGTIYEEYIENPLPSNIVDLNDLEIIDLVKVASIIDNMGYYPISFLNDLRLQSGIIYYTDFGTDLGQPSKGRYYGKCVSTLQDIIGKDRMNKYLMALSIQ